MQAVQHAYDPWMPGGAFPEAFVFVDIDPALVDFNIHPAKKEARFRDLPAIRHRLIETIRDRLTAESYRKRVQKSGSQENPQGDLIPTPGVSSPRPAYPAQAAMGSLFPPPRVGPESTTVCSWVSFGGVFSRDSAGRTIAGTAPAPDEAEAFADAAARLRKGEGSRLPRHTPVHLDRGSSFRYLGQVMGVFLVAESSGSLFLVDQHAAHERVLYERYLAAEPEAEQLLIPRPLQPTRRHR